MIKQKYDLSLIN